MNKKKKSKAFTLTELLVIVVVIGVLSAVVLPKFSKVIETRRTTEAEELMASIRTEQERRCALDKKYITDDISKLNDIVKNPDTKNYRIELASTGIRATRKDTTYNYTLQMPSYADGRICCDSEACEKLNKNYPTCDELRGKEDYQDSPESCAGATTPEPPAPKACTGNSSQSCGCQGKGTQTRTCDTTTGTWSAWSACSVSEACECTGTPQTSQACTAGNTCGLETRTATCNTSTGNWEYGTWSKSGCQTKPADEVGECAERTRSAVCKNNAWTWGEWTGECEEKDCCDEGFTGDFAECIKKKYGYDSVEYTCASGGTAYSSQWNASFGSFRGASACAWKINIGSAGPIIADTDNSKVNMCQHEPSYCDQYRTENSVWIAGGFKKYACTGATPTAVKNTGSSGSGSGLGKPYTCTVTSEGTSFYCGAHGISCPSVNVNSCPWGLRYPGDVIQCSGGGECPEKRQSCYNCASTSGSARSDYPFSCQKFVCR